MTARLTIALCMAGLVAGCGGDDDSSPAEGGSGTEPAGLLPEGGEVPEQEVTDLKEAVAAADCRLSSSPGGSAAHTQDPAERVDYDTNPPTTGRHFVEAAADGAYEEAPTDEMLVHSHEHGRVVVWFSPDLPADARADLWALFGEDTYQMLLVPRSDMPFEVAATAWNRDPTPDGTGRLLGCERFSERIFDAVRAFRDEHRSKGPEAVP
jgi:Protein of unknown function (DUF3105)